MRKRLLALIIIILLLYSFFLVTYADTNVEGGGKELSTANDGSVYKSDGVRITVIDVENGNVPVGQSFDVFNKNAAPPESAMSYVKTNKLELMDKNRLAPQDGYHCFAPPNGTPLPPILGSGNILGIKAFFDNKMRRKFIADNASLGGTTVTPEDLLTERYEIMVEPLAHFTYNYVPRVMSATEAAIMNRVMSGKLHDVIGNVTSRNLPAAMFLETKAFGIDPWTGGIRFYNDDEIINYLGVAQVKFKEGEESPFEIHETYRVNTSVIVSYPVSGEVRPEKRGDALPVATFQLMGESVDTELTSQSFVVPSGETQLVWSEWETPDKPQTVKVILTYPGEGSKIFYLEVEELVEITPPNPTATDQNPDLNYHANPSKAELPVGKTMEFSRSWKVWDGDWEEKTESTDGGTDVPDGSSGSSGGGGSSSGGSSTKTTWEWEFKENPTEYKATLGATGKIRPADSVPWTYNMAESNFELRSGYGVFAEVSSNVTGSGSANTTGLQTAILTFPEFEYEMYNRILEQDAGDWGFKINPYSIKGEPVHFTPVWYRDNQNYPVQMDLRDAWTPAGELRREVLANNITIKGSVFDDWYVQRSR